MGMQRGRNAGRGDEIDETLFASNGRGVNVEERGRPEGIRLTGSIRSLIHSIGAKKKYDR
jgi:hypothetical protein